MNVGLPNLLCACFLLLLIWHRWPCRLCLTKGVSGLTCPLQAMSVFRIHDIKTLKVSPFIVFLCWGQHECLWSHCFYFSDSCVYFSLKLFRDPRPWIWVQSCLINVPWKGKWGKRKRRASLQRMLLGQSLKLVSVSRTQHFPWWRANCLGIGNNVELGEVIIFYVMGF